MIDALGLRGKPAPDSFLEGARRLGVRPDQAAVFEDALAGVEAGRAGKFGYVVGVDRVGHRAALLEHGADVVVDDLAELLVITHPAFTVEPWAVTEDMLQLDVLAQSESVFALSNGHIGLRGNLDEGEPFGLPGTYLNGLYETRPLPYAEAGYGYPEDGQTVVNATNGKIIRLLVDDEPFDIRYGELLDAHAHARPARGRTAARRPLALPERDARSRSKSTRIVSFVQRSVAAIRYEVRADRRPQLRVVAQSELVANEPGGAAVAAIRAPRRRCGRRWRPRTRRSTTCASCSSTARRRAGCGWRRGWTTSSKTSTGSSPGPRPRRTSAASG